MAERTINRYRYWCNTESSFKYEWAETAPAECVTDSGHSIDGGSVTIVDTVSDRNRFVRGANTGGDGQQYNASVSAAGELSVDVPFSAFGGLRVTPEHPVIQVDARYGLDPLIFAEDTTSSGDISSADTVITLSSGTSSSGSAVLTSRKYMTYKAGYGAYMMFTTAFDAPRSGNIQIAGGGSEDNGVFVGYNGTTFGALRRCDGDQTWYPKTSWNADRVDGSGGSGQTIDPQKFNMWKIEFQWLGYGVIRWMVANPATGRFVTVHEACLANTATTKPSMMNPSFPMRIECSNSSGGTDVELRFTCFGAFLEGTRNFLGLTWGVDNTTTVSSNYWVRNVITIRNKHTFRGTVPFINVTLVHMAIGAEGTKSVEVYLVKNADISGSQNYRDVNSDSSVVEYDTNGTYISNGTTINVIAASRNSTQNVDLSSFNVNLIKGDTVTVACRLFGSGSNDVVASLTWQEDR
nr:hypothetical protein TetV2_00273 [Oceanusvirus sp.]